MLKDWHRWFDTFTGVAALTVLALPVAVLTMCALVCWRRATGATRAWAWRMALSEVGLVYGTVPTVWLTVLRGSRGGVTLVPFQDLRAILAAGPGSATGQIVGNLLVLAALGFFGPMRFTALASLPRIVALAAGCSVLIETLQYVLQLDRVSSVDDVLVNTVGAGLAALASRRWWRTASPRRFEYAGDTPGGLR